MGEQYFKGVLAGYLGANFMCGPITEWQIDIIIENISHYCEAMIDHSQLSYQEKEDQKALDEATTGSVGIIEISLSTGNI